MFLKLTAICIMQDYPEKTLVSQLDYRRSPFIYIYIVLFNVRSVPVKVHADGNIYGEKPPGSQEENLTVSPCATYMRHTRAKRTSPTRRLFAHRARPWHTHIVGERSKLSFCLPVNPTPSEALASSRGKATALYLRGSCGFHALLQRGGCCRASARIWLSPF